jgi:exonuclease III
MNINIIALQEPSINAYNLTIASKEWMTICPTTHSSDPSKTRAVSFINAHISTDNWIQIDFPLGDVTAIQLTGKWGKMTIFNIYNEGNSNETIQKLTKFHRENQEVISTADMNHTHIIWLGDFNRHHLHWDDPSDTRLFTNRAIKAAEVLIEAVAEVGLEMALPSGIPTQCHNVTKWWSRLDQVFISEHSEELLISCDALTDHRGIKTDHLPILTEVNLETNITKERPLPNFRKMDWMEF